MNGNAAPIIIVDAETIGKKPPTHKKQVTDTKAAPIIKIIK